MTRFITKEIKEALINALKDNLEPTQNGTTLMEVAGSTTYAFEKFPAARVLPNDVDLSTETNRSNERASAFTILIHIELEEKPDSEEDAYDTMYDLQDIVINKLDSFDWTNTLNILKTQATYGGYEILEMKTGLNLVFRIDVTATYSHNV